MVSDTDICSTHTFIAYSRQSNWQAHRPTVCTCSQLHLKLRARILMQSCGVWLRDKEKQSTFTLCTTKYFTAPVVGTWGSWRNNYVNNLGICLCGSSFKPTERQYVLHKLPVRFLLVSPASQQSWGLDLTYPRSAGCIEECRPSSHKPTHPLTADGKLINCLVETAGLW